MQRRKEKEVDNKKEKIEILPTTKIKKNWSDEYEKYKN